jgi:hypothetical protein
MKNFMEKNGLKGYQNVIVRPDTANFFMKYYKLNCYPFNAFYNKEGALQYVYNRETKMEKFISMVQKLD